MKVTLSLPSEWKERAKYEGKFFGRGSKQWRKELGDCIRRAIARTERDHLYNEGYQGEPTVRVQWGSQWAMVRICAKGNSLVPTPMLYWPTVHSQVEEALRDCGFVALVPECTIEIYLTFHQQHSYPPSSATS